MIVYRVLTKALSFYLVDLFQSLQPESVRDLSHMHTLA